MKLKWIANNTQVIASALGVAAFAVGCSSTHTGGSYAETSTAPPYTETETTTAVGGTAETQESTSGAQTQVQTSASGTQTIPLYKEQVNVGTRQVPSGTVTLRKVVKTETVSQPVTLQRETVVISREPSSTGAEPGAQAFQNQQITIPLHHDEPYVTTQVVPNGQVVATTKSDTQQTTVQKQIRSEDVAVDKGNAQNVIIQGNVNQGQGAMGGTGDTSEQSTGGSQNQNK